MKKHFVFSNLLPIVLLVIVFTALYSCSGASKTDSVKEKSLKVSNKKSAKPSCCATGIPARFPVKSSVEK
jgi:uncharacterized metal-binding protein